MEYPLSDLGAIHIPTYRDLRHSNNTFCGSIPQQGSKRFGLVEQVVPHVEAVGLLLVKVWVLRTGIHSTLYRVRERWSESNIRPIYLRWVEFWRFNLRFRSSKGLVDGTELLRNNRPLFGLPPEYPLLSLMWWSLVLLFQFGKALDHPGNMGLVLTRLLVLGGAWQ